MPPALALGSCVRSAVGSAVGSAVRLGVGSADAAIVGFFRCHLHPRHGCRLAPRRLERLGQGRPQNSWIALNAAYDIWARPGPGRELLASPGLRACGSQAVPLLLPSPSLLLTLLWSTRRCWLLNEAIK